MRSIEFFSADAAAIEGSCEDVESGAGLTEADNGIEADGCSNGLKNSVEAAS